MLGNFLVWVAVKELTLSDHNRDVLVNEMVSRLW